MTYDEALYQLACECPRKVLGMLHARGRYLHCSSPRFPGKVLCFSKDTPLPDDCVPTPAQAALWEGNGATAQPPAAHG